MVFLTSQAHPRYLWLAALLLGLLQSESQASGAESAALFGDGPRKEPQKTKEPAVPHPSSSLQKPTLGFDHGTPWPSITRDFFVHLALCRNPKAAKLLYPENILNSSTSITIQSSTYRSWEVLSLPSAPFWRARCAFAWQLCIADASERGSGQCPTLFAGAVAQLLGEPGDAWLQSKEGGG